MKIRIKETKDRAFALPTVLIVSVVMLMILTTAVSATTAIRQSLRNQRYTELAQLAGEAGTAYAKACMQANGGIVTWTDDKPLKPNTDCSGNITAGLPMYVLQQGDIRTYFVVKAPIAGNISGQGYLEALRSSTGLAWQVWGAQASAAALGSDMPVGTSLEGYWTAAPSGYLLEDGAAVSRTTYPELFAVIGTTFGAGNGSTTFNLPDSRGRVMVNKSSDSEFNVLGEKSGEKTHVLTINEMPSHSHSINDPGHQHTEGFAGVNQGASWGVAGSAPSGNINGQNGQNTSYHPYTSPSTTGITINNTGGGAAHNVIQPSIVVLRVIKF